MSIGASSGSMPFAGRREEGNARVRRYLSYIVGDVRSAIVSVIAIALLVSLLPRLLDWAVLDSVWSGGGEACRAAGGACWAFLRAKYRLVLFGIYPTAEQWRPLLVIALIVALGLWSLAPRNWTRHTLVAWIIGIALAIGLLRGGFLGLSHVPTSAWGGLPVTLLLTVLSLASAFPIAVILAFGRRSRALPTRLVSIGFIETVRALPLVSILFIASILLPIVLPDGYSIDVLLRALAALTLSSAAYLAEVLRGGLQDIPKGQTEAADALGLGRLQTARLIVLPQAIGKVIPPLASTVIVTVKNTSLVLVVGLFDLLSAGRAALTDPTWPMPYAETYLLIAAIYFAICFPLSRYAAWLERRQVSEGIK